MKKLSQSEAVKFDNANPSNQDILAGSRIKDEEDYSLYQMNFEITGDATGGLNLPALPFDLEIVDVIAHARAAVGGGTVILRRNSSAITSAIVLATANNVTRAAAINPSFSSNTEGTILNVICNLAGCRGLITIVGIRR